MKTLIKQQLKQLGIKQAAFCEEHGYKYKDFSTKVTRMQTRITKINEFLRPLKLKLIIIELKDMEK